VTFYQFIFSTKRKHRVVRQLAFWMLYYLYTILTDLPDQQIKNFTDPALYRASLYDALEYLPVFLLSVYFSIYFILPKFLAKRNISFLILSSLLLIAVAVPSGYFISKAILEKSGGQWDELTLINRISRKCVNGLIIITGSAIIIKIMKDYSLRQGENEMLAIENARNKLQLLKMQMHPRILFGCLQNIYNDIDAGTLYAPEMILKLSDLLSYLLYEAESKQVSLDKEVKMIQNYIALKKIEYKNKLDIYFEMSGDMSTHYITPGLFLPLLEIGIASFEKPEKPIYVSIELKTNAAKIYFNLKNNIPGIQMMKMPSAQATLESTKRRLQIFHVDKFKLEVHSAADSFTIMLQLEQDQIINPQHQNIQNGESLIYEHA
jgi:two-component system, LytTR family, sensor kinase